MRNLTENLALCLAASTIEATSKHCLARLEQQWQRRLTERIHHNYFENMVSCSQPSSVCCGWRLHNRAAWLNVCLKSSPHPLLA